MLEAREVLAAGLVAACYGFSRVVRRQNWRGERPAPGIYVLPLWGEIPQVEAYVDGIYHALQREGRMVQRMCVLDCGMDPYTRAACRLCCKRREIPLCDSKDCKELLYSV